MEERTILNASSPLNFACNEALPCFTRCCRNVNIYLTPYDVLRLRRALGGMPSGEFLARHTRHVLAKDRHIPIVQLLMEPDSLACSFVGDAGCKVYENRPWSCRMFPLDLSPLEPDTYVLMAGRDRCMGIAEPSSWTVGEWLERQGVGPYMEMEAAFQTVLPLIFSAGAKIDPGLGKLLFLAYDLDRFLAMLEDPRFRKFHDIDDETFERVKAEDEALLRLAFQYIRSQIEELCTAV